MSVVVVVVVPVVVPVVAVPLVSVVVAPLVVVWAPPPTEPFAASCCWIYCFSSGEMLFAVQLGEPPVATDNMLIDTPQILAARLIGI